MKTALGRGQSANPDHSRPAFPYTPPVSDPLLPMGDLRECPSCALEFEDDGQKACPYFGYEFPRQRTSVKAVAVVLILIMLWFALQGLF